MPTLSDIALKLFTLTVSNYIWDTDIPDIFGSQVVSRIVTKAITEELLFNRAKIVNKLKGVMVGILPPSTESWGLMSS